MDGFQLHFSGFFELSIPFDATLTAMFEDHYNSNGGNCTNFYDTILSTFYKTLKNQMSVVGVVCFSLFQHLKTL